MSCSRRQPGQRHRRPRQDRVRNTEPLVVTFELPAWPEQDSAPPLRGDFEREAGRDALDEVR